jgi:hypothetical protein
MKTKAIERPDWRVVYGVCCTWWGRIQMVGRLFGTVVCPHCGSMLLELPSMTEWWDGARKREADGHPGYVKLIEWSFGRCFASLAAMTAQYEVETGIKVKVD